jgi:uncharacterized protein YndB with AHSA1/START domain
MTSTEDATFPSDGVVRFDRTFNAPIGRVWQYLADPELRKTWMGGGEIELRPGGRVHIWYDHSNLTDEPQPAGGTFEPHFEDGTVVAVDPPAHLSYTWGEWFGQDCLVSFDFSTNGDGTRLVLTHSRIATTALSRDVARAWHVHLGMLSARVNDTPLPHLWAHFNEMSAHYADRDPAPAER